MQAGFFETDITPAVGMERPGGYVKAFVAAIHDPLKVRAAVFDDGTARVALVGVDSCMLPRGEAISQVRRDIEARCGIPSDHVLIAASHTHSGGPLFGFLERDFAGAPELVRALALEHSQCADNTYYAWALGQITTAVCEADRRREDALLSVGSGFEDSSCANRRFRMKNGRTYTHPGKGNPDILEPAGPIDPEVGVLAAWQPGGKLLGCIANFACHGTAWGGIEVSSDWIGHLDAAVKGAMDTDGPVVFLNGASGDITQIDNGSLREQEFGARWSRLVGARVGAEVLKVLVSAERGELAPVRAHATTLTLGRRRPGPERLEKSLALVQESLRSGATSSTEWTFAKEIVLLDYLAQRQPKLPVEVQAVQIGPAVFLANPSEFFCQLGLDIKQSSPFPYTFVVSLANGYYGYVPTEEAFWPSGGGYETVLTTFSNLETAAGKQIVETSLTLARSLTPGPVPEVPKISAPMQPWNYGVLGPDV